MLRIDDTHTNPAEATTIAACELVRLTPAGFTWMPGSYVALAEPQMRQIAGAERILEGDRQVAFVVSEANEIENQRE